MILYYNGQIFGYAPVELDPQKFQITKVDIDPVYNTYRFTVSPSFPSYYNSSTINRFESLVFLKKVPDETAMILEGKKGPFAGNTSYGFIVPELIDPNVMQNLNTLQSTVQSQLLDAGTTQNP